MCEPHGPADDRGFGKRRVVHALAAEFFLQSPCDFEDATLALHFTEIRFARDVGHILTEDEDFIVAPHFVFHAGIEQIDHRRRLAGELRVVFGIELLARGIDIRRIDRKAYRVRVRLGLFERVVRRSKDFGVDLFGHLREFRFGRVALVDQPFRKGRNRVACGVGFALCCRTVHHLVVRQGVRIRPNNLRMHQRWALTFAGVLNGLLHHLIRRQ